MKGGVLGTLLPILGGVAALGTGLGAAGIGPLAGLFSAGDAAATAGTGAADLGAGAGGALDVSAGAGGLAGTADIGATALSQAGLPGLATMSYGFEPTVDAGGGALIPDIANLSSAPLLPESSWGAAPSIGSLGGGITPASTQVASAAPSTFTDAIVGGGNIDQGAIPPVGPLSAADTLSPPTSVATSAFDPSAFSAAAPAFSSLSPADASSVIGPAFSAPTDAVSGMAPGQVGLGTPFDTGIASAGGDAAGGGGGSDFAGGAATPWWQKPQNYLALAPLALMAGESLFGNTVPGSQPVTAAAQTAAQNEGILTGQGTQNMSYVNTGALPAGAQTAIDQAANAAKAQVLSSFASMGVPPGSTMEAQQLAAVDQQSAVQKFDIQQKLLSAGISQFNAGGAYGGLVNQADLALMNAQIQQEQELEQALAGFAGAFAASGTTFGGGASA